MPEFATKTQITLVKASMDVLLELIKLAQTEIDNLDERLATLEDAAKQRENDLRDTVEGGCQCHKSP